MKQVNYDKDIKELFIILVVLILMLGYFTYVKFTYKEPVVDDNEESDVVDEGESNDTNFNINFIKNVNNGKSDNYLVSPYSVELALNMLRDGSNGDTLSEINNVIEERDIVNLAIKNRIGVANAMFVKNNFSDSIESDFYNNIKNTYGADIIYDEFANPDKINTWCKENTWDMIDKVMDEVDGNFVLGLANAIAIDVDWSNGFECNNTDSGKFIKNDGSEMDAQMMHNTYNSGVRYFDDGNSTGVVIPYKGYNSDGEEDNSGTQLEFIGILPNGDINSYINSFNNDTLNNIDNATEASEETNVNISLPRFSYDYSLDGFVDLLKTMGINSVFDENNADLTNIMSNDSMGSLGIDNLYVSNAVHKTHIDLNEKGTKAAAVTSVEVSNESVDEDNESESVDIEFNKPFIYMIRDSASKEILFFGTVYTPNEWSGSTCSNG